MDWHTYFLGFFLWLTSSGLLLTVVTKNSTRTSGKNIDKNNLEPSENNKSFVLQQDNQALIKNLQAQLDEKIIALNLAEKKIQKLQTKIDLTQSKLNKNNSQNSNSTQIVQEKNIHLQAQIDSLKEEIQLSQNNVSETENKYLQSQKRWQEKFTNLNSQIETLKEELILKNNKLSQTETKYLQLQKSWQEKSINFKLQIEALQEELNLTSDQLELTQNKYFNSQQEFEQQASNYRDKIEILEYKSKQLTKKLEQLPTQLKGSWQTESIASLQELLISYPTAKLMVELKHSVPAKNILALLKPLEQLLEKWGVETIGQPWKRVPYNPNIHDCGQEEIEAGQLVYIRWVGYHQGDRVLLPAKVSRKLPGRQ